jgi:drug/metabolite transporter (DMT)-like permease
VALYIWADSLNIPVGEAAALATSLLWSFTALFFAAAGKRTSSAAVNRSRLLFAVVLLSTAHLLAVGTLMPVGAAPFRWQWLGLSGLVGLALGDAALFQAFVLIGPRLAMLMMATVPIHSTLIGRVAFGEALSPAQIAGIALTVGGVAWVVTESRGSAPEVPKRFFMTGIGLGLLAAVGQAVGLSLARVGLVGDFPTVSATLIRTLVAVTVLWLWAALRGSARATVHSWRDRRALQLTMAGAVVGPFLGVWLSLVAIDNAPLGVAATLMALPPVLLIGLERMVYGTRVTRRGVVGTLVAFGGVTVLLLG